MDDVYEYPIVSNPSVALDDIPGESCGQCFARQSPKISILFIMCGLLISAAGIGVLGVAHASEKNSYLDLFIIGFGLAAAGLMISLISVLAGVIIYTNYESRRSRRNGDVPISFVHPEDRYMIIE